MGAPGPRTLTLDAGALIAIERGDERLRAMLALAAGRQMPVYVPAPVVAEVWRGGSGRQARLAVFLRNGERHGHVTIVAMDGEAARLVGVLLSRAGATAAGVVDAMVAWCTIQFNGHVVTSDPQDIQRL